MNPCPQCKSNDMRLISRLGALETWRCGSCSHEVTYHVNDPSVEPIGLRAQEPIFTLMGTWTAKPGGAQLARLKELSPRLRIVADSTLLRHAIEGARFEIGRFNDSEMREMDLDSKLAELGLRLERAPVPGVNQWITNCR
jgi:hypothetical protein